MPTFIDRSTDWCEPEPESAVRISNMPITDTITGSGPCNIEPNYPIPYWSVFPHICQPDLLTTKRVTDLETTVARQADIIRSLQVLVSELLGERRGR